MTANTLLSIGGNVILIGGAVVSPGGSSSPTVPNAPTGVTATAGNAQATVSWTAPYNGGAAITGYTVTSVPATTSQNFSTTSGAFTGLTNGTSYVFYVTATNSVGTGAAGGPSNAVTPTATQAATPTFSPPAGTYSSAQSVVPSSSTSGSSIYYTTDGTTPTYPISGTTQLYSSPISVSSSETIEAIAVASGYSNSSVGSAAYVITTGGLTQIFNYSSGFTGVTGNFNASNGQGGFSGSVMQVVNGSEGEHQAAGVWYKTLVSLTSGFTTQFQFQFPNIGYIAPASRVGDSGGGIFGLTFCVQNSNTSTNPEGTYGPESGINAGTDANMCGYGIYSTNPSGEGVYGIGNSVAIFFNVGSQSGNVVGYDPNTGYPNATGIQTNGGSWASQIPFEDMNPYSLNLNLGHVMQANVVYDGTYLTMVLTDLTTSASGRYTWPITLTNVCGSSAYFGFTAGSINADVIAVNNWSLYTGINTRLSTPTFSVAAGQYTSSQTVTISGPSGSTIYYSTNGLPPTAHSTQYTGAVTVSSSTVLQAVAIQSGFTDSFVGSAYYQIATGSPPTINFPGGFSSAAGLIVPTGSAKLSGSTLYITQNTAALDEGPGTLGAAWFASPVSISSFTCTFTWQMSYNNLTGIAFVMQNHPVASTYGSGGQNTGNVNAPTLANSTWGVGGVCAVGTGSQDANSCGYSGSTGDAEGTSAATGLMSSAAVTFDVNANTINYCTGGSLPSSGAIGVGSGVSLQVENSTYTITITYSGTSLAVQIVEGGNTFSHTFTGVNIATAVGASTAYVGFVGGNYDCSVNHTLASWTMT